MKNLSFTCLLFIVCFAYADIGQQLQQQSDKTSRGIVANVAEKQKQLLKRIDLQMKIDKTRSDIATAKGEEKNMLEEKLQTLEKQKGKL
ncbi:hypothetical protein MDN04_004231 [Salmonella enterica]|nr:hypothetical protein [Salmonella enterica]EDW0097573.1 hypothetical protein [Salmonella enterica subsp. enterica serovar Gaminara]EED6039349.1 hypothetical protein [Salmonella enterica subsp. enterica serovar Oranienburg]ECY2492853.1 hypothetical protein [Salmonella enterica]EDO1879220.1 hypothetical protein [Salmonella enterica]